jgi:hypothetical protein
MGVKVVVLNNFVVLELKHTYHNLYVSILFASLTVQFYFIAIFTNQHNTLLLLLTIDTMKSLRVCIHSMFQPHWPSSGVLNKCILFLKLLI